MSETQPIPTRVRLYRRERGSSQTPTDMGRSWAGLAPCPRIARCSAAPVGVDGFTR